MREVKQSMAALSRNQNIGLGLSIAGVLLVAMILLALYAEGYFSPPLVVGPFQGEAKCRGKSLHEALKAAKYPDANGKPALPDGLVDSNKKPLLPGGLGARCTDNGWLIGAPPGALCQLRNGSSGLFDSAEHMNCPVCLAMDTPDTARGLMVGDLNGAVCTHDGWKLSAGPGAGAWGKEGNKAPDLDVNGLCAPSGVTTEKLTEWTNPFVSNGTGWSIPGVKAYMMPPGRVYRLDSIAPITAANADLTSSQSAGALCNMGGWRPASSNPNKVKGPSFGSAIEVE